MRAETMERLVDVGFDPDLLNEPGGFWRDRAELLDGRFA